jgi:cytochrome P450
MGINSINNLAEYSRGKNGRQSTVMKVIEGRQSGCYNDQRTMSNSLQANQLALFDPFLPDFPVNRYRYYRHFRERDPVHQGIAPTPNAGTSWYLFGHSEVTAALRDERLRRRRGHSQDIVVPETIRPFLEMSTSWLVFQDPPHHTRLRALVNKAFTPRTVANLYPRIQQITDYLLDAAAAQGDMDLIADFAFPLPVMIIGELLGVPVADRGQMRQWSAVLAAAVDARPSPDIFKQASEVTLEMEAYLQQIINQRRREPQDDLISALLAAEAEDGKLSERELIAMCMLLLVAGHETTVNLIGNGSLALLQNPEQHQKLTAHPGLIAPAIEELLRYDSPVQMVSRFAAADMVVQDKLINKGDTVILVLGSANRDPAYFAHPDMLDIGRQPGNNVAFGLGIHFCVGAPLARAEGQLAIGTLVRRFPHLRLQSETPIWRPHVVFAGLEKLPVFF